MAVLLDQFLDADDDRNITLTNKLFLDPLLKENMEERKAIGKAIGSNWKPICSIPVPVLENDPDGKLFLLAPSGTSEARIALKRFLAKPENAVYRTSTVNL